MSFFENGRERECVNELVNDAKPKPLDIDEFHMPKAFFVTIDDELTVDERLHYVTNLWMRWFK